MSRGPGGQSVRPGIAIAVVTVVAAVGGVAWWSVRRSGSTATTSIERVVEVTSGPLRQSVTASGTLKPANTADLNFAVPGKVTAVNASAAQKVTKGDALATVDSAALQSAVAQAQATVDTAQAKLSTDTTNGATAAQLDADSANVTANQSSLASAQAALAGATLASPIDGTVASVNLTVGQQLGGSGSSASSLTGSSTGSGQTRASASANSASGGAGGGGANASAAGSTSAASPAAAAQIQVISTDSYVVDLGVDDTQIGRIAAGQQASVTLSSSPVGNGGGGFGGGGGGFGGARAAAAGAGGATGQGNSGGQDGATTPSQAPTGPGGGAPATAATGTVTSVGVIATSTSGVATFPVEVTVAGNPSGFHAGATASVAITYQELPDVVQVPAAAVTRSNGQSTVTVSAGGTRSSRSVVTGITAGGQVQVTSGLAPGDQVIISVPVAGSVGGNRNGGGSGNTGRTGTGRTGTGSGTRNFGGGG